MNIEKIQQSVSEFARTADIHGERVALKAEAINAAHESFMIFRSKKKSTFTKYMGMIIEESFVESAWKSCKEMKQEELIMWPFNNFIFTSFRSNEGYIFVCILSIDGTDEEILYSSAIISQRIGQIMEIFNFAPRIFQSYVEIISDVYGRNIAETKI